MFALSSMRGELNHVVKRAIVSHETRTYQNRVNLIGRSGLTDWIRAWFASAGEVKTRDIGSGYRALCYWIKEAFQAHSIRS